MGILEIVIAIAVLGLIVWLLLQPKQGSRASNALDDFAADDRNSDVELTPPEISQPQLERESAPIDHTSQRVETPVTPDDGMLAAEPAAAEIRPSPESPLDFDAEIYQLLAAGQKITAVKRVREVKNWGLKESKQYVDTLERQQTSPSPMATSPEIQADRLLNAPAPHLKATPEIKQAVHRLLAEHQKLAAVKLVRQEMGWHLWEAKKYVDNIQEKEYQPAIRAALENLAPEIKQEVRQLVASMYKGMAVKRLQDATGCSLVEAVDYIEKLTDTPR